MDSISNGGPSDKPFSDGPRNRITLRRFVLLLVSAAASALVWQRTGGDYALSVLTTPIVFGALDHWVWDDPSGERRAAA